jgi:hypothetical protein
MEHLTQVQRRVIEHGENGVRRHMAIQYQEANVPWWHGRSMFRMLHETFITEYTAKRHTSRLVGRRHGEIPYEAGVVGFWVSQDGIVMSTSQKLHRYVLVGMDPLDREYLEHEVPDTQANVYWSAYVQGYWVRDTAEAQLRGDWQWIPNPVYAGYMARGEIAFVPSKPIISDKFLADSLTIAFAPLFVA